MRFYNIPAELCCYGLMAIGGMGASMSRTKKVDLKIKSNSILCIDLRDFPNISNSGGRSIFDMGAFNEIPTFFSSKPSN